MPDWVAAKGVHVIWLTARLQNDARRRLNETAQFLMDVTVPASFDEGGSAIARIQHVRQMHAAIRWFIDHDTPEAVAHARLNTTPAGVETCAICHGDGRDVAVDRVHAK